MDKLYQITTNKTEYDRKIQLRELFIENKLDITNIKFSNPSAKFKISLDEISICQLGGLGMGLFPKIFDISKNYEIIENYLNPFTTPNILDVLVDLSSFYDDPFPFDFDNSPRISPKYIAIYFYNEIIKSNKITSIDWNLIKLDTYEKQADFLNSITAFGKPVMRITPEYLAMEDEKNGFQSKKKLKDMIG